LPNKAFLLYLVPAASTRTENADVGFEEMKKIIASLIIVSAVGCSHRGDPRLSGTFVSDKSATLAYLESTGEYDTNRLAKLGALFGRLEVTYQGTKATTLLNGREETEKFRIVDSGTNHVSIETQFGTEELLGKAMMVTNRIEFSSDGYWVTSPMMKESFREKFVRKGNPTTPRTVP
jgi:hypothetical protein